MYWKSKTEIIDGVLAHTYSFFHLTHNSNLPRRFFNSASNKIEHAIQYEMQVQDRVFPSEMDFLEWYHRNKTI